MTLGLIHLLKGKIFYSKADEFDHLVDVHKESFAEALELIKAEALPDDISKE